MLTSKPSSSSVCVVSCCCPKNLSNSPTLIPWMPSTMAATPTDSQRAGSLQMVVGGRDGPCAVELAGATPVILLRASDQVNPHSRKFSPSPKKLHRIIFLPIGGDNNNNKLEKFFFLQKFPALWYSRLRRNLWYFSKVVFLRDIYPGITTQLSVACSYLFSCQDSGQL